MLSNDAKTKQENDKGEQKTLEERCRISTRLSTPRMLDTVVKVLPENSVTGQQLRSAIGTLFRQYFFNSLPNSDSF